MTSKSDPKRLSHELRSSAVIVVDKGWSSEALESDEAHWGCEAVPIEWSLRLRRHWRWSAMCNVVDGTIPATKTNDVCLGVTRRVSSSRAGMTSGVTDGYNARE